MTVKIHSNGSKWFGQKPDPISKLYTMLAEHPLQKGYNYIARIDPKHHRFSGNFEDYSHVFSVDVPVGSVEDRKLFKLFTSNRRKYLYSTAKRKEV